MDWTKDKPKLTKDGILICLSIVGFSRYAYCYDVKEHDEGVDVIDADGDIVDYSKFKYAFYKLIKYPESEVNNESN